MSPPDVLQQFIKNYCTDSAPFLLALSGGADSLCLFYALLACRIHSKISFHVAHVDHGWRPESADEALQLQRLVEAHGVDFHLRQLDPDAIVGNPENFCRDERYSFFKELNDIHFFQGVFVGHHGDDQAETVFKRVLEGAHWSRLGALKSKTAFRGLNLLRPFLSLKKREILSWLNLNGIVPFEDSTNEDIRFLRARMRQVIFPSLTESFGKNIDQSFLQLGRDASELTDYFDRKVQPILLSSLEGPFGSCLDLHGRLPESLLEIKYLVRKFCDAHQFYLSRSSIDLLAGFLQAGAANRRVETGAHVIWVDRQKMFIPRPLDFTFSEIKIASQGEFIHNGWTVSVGPARPVLSCSGMLEAWKGHFRVVLPVGDYKLALAVPGAPYLKRSFSVAKWWNNNKIPAFLRSMVPVIWQDDFIRHEFLTGKSSAMIFDEPREWVEIHLQWGV
jgi:tRNA(Ile)-lysidine synthase